MIKIWRLGFERAAFPLQAIGWRHLVGPLWWFSPKVEARVLEAYAKVINVERLPEESNEDFRKRLLETWLRVPL